MVTHRKGSTHKRRSENLIQSGKKANVFRLKALKDEPYTQKEAEAAIGLRTDNGPRRTAIESIEVEMENSGLEENLTT